MTTAGMTEAKITLDQVKDPITFANKVCSQCNLCFRTPNNPEEFCWTHFVRSRMDFIEGFVLRIIHARNKGRDVNVYRQKKMWREIFCHIKKGICTQRGKCNKRKKKRCYRKFNDQILVLDLESLEPTATKKTGGKKKGRKGKKVHGVDDNWWQDEAYGYVGGAANYNYKKDLPEVTVIGKKKFQDKVEKILDEDTDK